MQQETHRTAPTTSTSPRRVLVVDDNKDIRDTFQELLIALGHEARIATEGWDALEIAEDFKPDVVLCDLGLPGMTGYDIARELRRTPHGKDTVLVAVTGWGRSADVELSYRAGFDLHLAKPLGVRDLCAIVASAKHAE
jgi:CheY-like chemotaxis protein